MSEHKLLHKLTILHPDGTRSIAYCKGAPSLRDLQVAVRGYIEPIPHFKMFEQRSVVGAYANEDGRNLKLEGNDQATKAWAEALDGHADTLVGDIVIVTRELPERIADA